MPLFNDMLGIAIQEVQLVKLYLITKNAQVDDECYHQKYPKIAAWAIKEAGIEDLVDWYGEM